MNNLYLIDGHSLIFRMYYAFIRRPMINSKGEDTSILYGFTKYLLELIRKEQPTHIAVAFDPPGKTFRNELFPEYKANRSETPELIKSSLQPLIEIVKSFGIPVLMIPGYEADDVIGTMAKKGEKHGFKVFMVTPDKDLGQIISDNIIQFKPGKSGAENEIVGKEEICEKFDIKDPAQIIDILTLWGDSSDNIPGVRGVGEVGAKKLIAKYGSVENIYQHLSELPEKQAEAFRSAESYINLSKELVTIKTDVDLNINEEELRLDAPNSARTRELFSKYEFNSLLPLLPTPTTPLEKEENNNNIEVKKLSLSQIQSSASKEKRVGILINSGWLLLSNNEGVFSTRNFAEARTLLEERTIKKIGYDLKQYIHTLREHGISFEGDLADIELMHYLLNPERTHKAEILARSYLGIDIDASPAPESPPATGDLFSQGDLFGGNLFEEKVDDSISKDTRKAMVLIPLYEVVEKELAKDEQLVKLYEKMEMPLIRVLADMEQEGFKIDVPMLFKFKEELTTKVNIIEENIRSQAESPSLNVSSPKQLGVILYEKLKLDPKVKKNKNGSYPTDEETLNGLLDKHPIVADILEYRELKKLISTYVEPFPSFINPRTKKVHTTFNQALTSTGRLSSVRPNLQNIPIRTDLGREIRKAFIPSRPDGYLVSADYSQIELRIMAILSKDRAMIEDFHSGKDIHNATASRVFHINENEVSKEQRRMAKVANFGIIYGISAFGLSQRLNIPPGESRELIKEYFKNYPGVHNYMERIKEQAEKDGYVETLYNRKRYLPDINSKNRVVKGLAERNAINAPIQGSAADIIKIAMINVHRRFATENLRSKMILQVHDELIFDVIPEEREKVMRVVQEEMESVLRLEVTLNAECGYGKNWLEAH